VALFKVGVDRDLALKKLGGNREKFLGIKAKEGKKKGLLNKPRENGTTL